MFFQASQPIHSYFLERIIYPSPLCIFFGGDFAVYIFFVLSGFVLSLKYFFNPDVTSLKTQFFRRYVRLMPPAAVTVIVSCIILRAGYMYNNQVAIIANSWWLNLNWHDVDSSPYNALWQSLWGVWFTKIPPNIAFNSNLGTLFIEVLGSFITFVFLIICISLKISKFWRYFFQIFIIGFSLQLKEPHYAVFLAGMFIADIYVNSKKVFEYIRKFGWFFLITGIYLGSFNIANSETPWNRIFSNVFNVYPPPWYMAWACGAICLLLSALTVQPFQKLLESRIFKMLGSYSYSLYLCHTIFLGSVTCFLFIKIMELQKYNYEECVLLSFLSGLPLLMLFVYCVKKVDDFSTRLSRKI